MDSEEGLRSLDTMERCYGPWGRGPPPAPWGEGGGPPHRGGGAVWTDPTQTLSRPVQTSLVPDPVQSRPV